MATHYTVTTTPRPTLGNVAHWLEYLAAAADETAAEFTPTERAPINIRATAWLAAARQIRALSSALKNCPQAAAGIMRAHSKGHAALPPWIDAGLEGCAGVDAWQDIATLFALEVKRTPQGIILRRRQYGKPTTPKPEETKAGQEEIVSEETFWTNQPDPHET